MVRDIALGAIGVIIFLFGFGVYMRVKYGVFCDRCKRPIHRCSCIEDGFVDPPHVIEFPARRKKPFDIEP